MGINYPTALTLLVLIISSLNIQAQDKSEEFHWTPFKYSKEELPFSFGGGPSIGWGSRGPGLGMVLEADFYHILIGGRLAHYPMHQDHHSIMSEKCVYVGYQYRVSRVMANFGIGIGNQAFFCSSGISGDCYGEEDERYTSKVIKAEFAYLLNRVVCTYISINYSSCDRQDVFSIMTGMKFGLFKRAEK